MKCRLPILMDQYNARAFEAGGTRLSQTLLAEKTGIAASTISRLFTGVAQRVDFSTAEKLCNFFECEVGDLLALVESNEAE